MTFDDPISSSASPAPASSPAPAPFDSGGSDPAPAATQSVSLPTQQASEPSTPMTPAQKEAWEHLPKAWRKEMESRWGTIDPEVRKYVHEREQQAFRGIQQYSQGHNNWNKVLEPFQPLLQEYPDLDAADLFRTLGQNHLVLTRGTPEQKAQMFNAMVNHYGLREYLKPADPNKPAPQQPFSPEQMQFLRQALGPVLQKAQVFEADVQKRRMAEAETSVDKFFSDPQNEFAEEVGQDMLDLLQRGRASDLSEAYEMAILRNPEVKAKYLASLAAKAGKSAGAPAQLNVKSSTAPATPVRPATIDESIAAVVKKHYG